MVGRSPVHPHPPAAGGHRSAAPDHPAAGRDPASAAAAECPPTARVRLAAAAAPDETRQEQNRRDEERAHPRLGETYGHWRGLSYLRRRVAKSFKESVSGKGRVRHPVQEIILRVPVNRIYD